MSKRNDPILPLDQLNRPTVTTREAAFYLNREEQTMRFWAFNGGPITPLRVNRRLMWPVSEIKKLLGVE